MPKKSGLGKGIESLFSDSQIETGKSKDESIIDINKIKPNPNQPRKEFDQELLNQLTDSIAQNGILQPLLVRKQGKNYEIVCGERRYQAALKAGLKELPVVVREVDDEDIFKLALIENLQRSDLNPIEEALGYKRLLTERELTQEALARLISKSRSNIANMLRLLDLPEEVQDYLAQKLISAGHARAILVVPTYEGRVKLAQKVIDEKLSVRQTESLATLFSVNQEDKPKKQPTPASYKRVARQLRTKFDTTVKVKRVKGKNKIEIDFKDEEDLERIIKLMEVF